MGVQLVLSACVSSVGKRQPQRGEFGGGLEGEGTPGRGSVPYRVAQAAEMLDTSVLA